MRESFLRRNEKMRNPWCLLSCCWLLALAKQSNLGKISWEMRILKRVWGTTWYIFGTTWLICTPKSWGPVICKITFQRKDEYVRSIIEEFGSVMNLGRKRWISLVFCIKYFPVWGIGKWRVHSSSSSIHHSSWGVNFDWQNPEPANNHFLKSLLLNC